MRFLSVTNRRTRSVGLLTMVVLVVVLALTAAAPASAITADDCATARGFGYTQTDVEIAHDAALIADGVLEAVPTDAISTPAHLTAVGIWAIPQGVYRGFEHTYNIAQACDDNDHQQLVKDNLVGTPDTTPAAIKEEAEKASLKDVDLPSCTVAGKPINNGDRARCFSQYMRIHALEATGGLVYAEMPRFATDDAKGTSDPEKASKGPSGRPLDNPARQIWITETALATALNVSYMADQLSLGQPRGRDRAAARRRRLHRHRRDRSAAPTAT